MGSSSPIFWDEHKKNIWNRHLVLKHMHELFETLATAMENKLVYPTKTSMYLSHLKNNPEAFSHQGTYGWYCLKNGKTWGLWCHLRYEQLTSTYDLQRENEEQ